MNTCIRLACIALIATAAGCGGNSPGNVDSHAGDPPNPRPDQTPPVIPPVAGSVDCSTTSFPKSSAMDALPGGLWHGTLVDCSNNLVPALATALVTEDGRFRIIGEQGHWLTGSMTTDGDTFNGSGFDFAPTGWEYFSGPTTRMFVAGSVLERGQLQGRWGTEWGFYGYFSFEYQQDIYEKPTSLEGLAGAWPTYSSPELQGVWTVEPDGRFNGQDADGCLQSGRFALIDASFSILDVEVTVSGCELAGTYSGLAYREDLVDWWESAIDVYVDDGSRALRILLLKQAAGVATVSAGNTEDAITVAAP